MEFLTIPEQIGAYLDQLVLHYGLLGIAVAMFAESAGLPFASTVVILASGSMILTGKQSFWAIFLASTIGIILGSVCSYSIGYLGSYMSGIIKTLVLSKYSRYRVRRKSYRRSKVYLLWERYGSFSIFMGQFWGVTRTFISFPAGAMHMNIIVFVTYTALGGAIFSLGAIGFSIIITSFAGLLLHSVRLIFSLSPWLWIVIALAACIMFYLYRKTSPKFSPLFLWRRGIERLIKKD